MKKSRVVSVILSVMLVMQVLVLIPLVAYAIEAPQLADPVVTATRITLDWNDVTGATSYEVWRSDNNAAFNLKTTTSQGETEYTDATVAEKNKYRYKVIAVENAVYYSYPSNIVTAYTDITPPTPPTNLQLTPAVNRITLNWTASTDNWGIEKYNIFGRAEGQQFAFLGSSTTRTYTHSNLPSNTSYYYYVKAVDNAQLESDASSVENASTSADTERPSNVTGLTANAISNTRIDLSWSSASDNAGSVSYVVHRSAANINGNNSEYTTSGRSYSFEGLTSGARYYFKVWAKDDAGNLSATAATVNTVAQSDTEKPTPPSIWGKSNSTKTKITLTWSGASDNKGVTAYDIFRVKSSTATPVYYVTDTDGSPYEDTNVDSDATYRYFIKAKDAAGNLSDASNTVSVTTNGDTTAPEKPANLQLSLVSNTQVKLVWSSSTDNRSVSGYKIYRSTNGDSFTFITTTSSTSYTNTGLTSGEDYSYYVKAYDAAGNESAASDSQSIYTSTSTRSDEENIDSDESGTLEITDLIRLEVPKYATDDDNIAYKITTKSFSSYTPTGYKTFGQPVEITAKKGSTSITNFNKDLTLTFYYTSSQLGSTSTDMLDIYYWDDDYDIWVALPSTVSSSSRKVTAKTNHLTVFALLGDTTAPSVPTLSNSSSSSQNIISLSGTAEKKAEVEILFNNSSSKVTAGLNGRFSKQVTLVKGRNEVKLRAIDAAGNQSAWSSVFTINYMPVMILSDITGHWAQQNILRVVEEGIASGYEDNSFRPDRTITRTEFCKFVVSAMDYTPMSNPQLNFKDSGNIPAWARGYVARAIEEGIISGYSDNTFRPSKEITREEMASLLVRAMGLQSLAETKKNGSLGFKDSSQVQSWSRGAVAVAVEKGLIRGYQDNTFGPRRKASRAEAVTMIVKMLDVL